jgi:Flp pilus assembly protein TadD
VSRMEPDRLESHRKAAALLLELGRHKQAIEPYQQAILLAPEEPALRYELGVCYSNLGQKAAAMAQYDALKKLDPGRAEELLFILEE